jgi:hypothetical protein
MVKIVITVLTYVAKLVIAIYLFFGKRSNKKARCKIYRYKVRAA